MKAFTLVEMLVVISIVLLLIGIAIPALTGVVMFVHVKQSQSIINQLDGAVLAYQMDFSISPNSPGNDISGLPPGNYIDSAGTSWYGCQAIVLYLTGYHDIHGNYGVFPSSAFGWKTTRNSRVYGPYNDTEKLKITPGNSMGFVDNKNVIVKNYNNTGVDQKFNDMISDISGNGIIDASGKMSHPTFLDAFGQPILYFSANYYNPTTKAFTYPIHTGTNIIDGNFCHDGIHNQDLFGNVYNDGVYNNRSDGINTGVIHTGPGLEETYEGVFSNLTPIFGPPPSSCYTNSATGAFYRSNFMLMSWGGDQQWGTKDDTNNLYAK